MSGHYLIFLRVLHRERCFFVLIAICTHNIHVGYIYLHSPSNSTVVGKYIMHGSYGYWHEAQLRLSRFLATAWFLHYFHPQTWDYHGSFLKIHKDNTTLPFQRFGWTRLSTKHNQTVMNDTFKPWHWLNTWFSRVIFIFDMMAYVNMFCFKKTGCILVRAGGLNNHQIQWSLGFLGIIVWTHKSVGFVYLYHVNVYVDCTCTYWDTLPRSNSVTVKTRIICYL